MPQTSANGGAPGASYFLAHFSGVGSLQSQWQRGTGHDTGSQQGRDCLSRPSLETRSEGPGNVGRGGSKEDPNSLGARSHLARGFDPVIAVRPLSRLAALGRHYSQKLAATGQGNKAEGYPIVIAKDRRAT